MQTIKIQCPAKINLNLKIIGKLPNGFHEIESVMQTISLYDYLTISVENSFETKIVLSGNSNEIPYDETNLVYKAAKLFLETVNIQNKKISIYIEKNIPVAAGLAGGSTDGAGTLYGLNKLFDEKLNEKTLGELCAKLGSDLNVCLKGGRILAQGRGEITTSLEFEEFDVSLIKPLNLGISAKEAYTKYSQKILESAPPTPACAGTSPCKGAEYDAKYLPPVRGKCPIGQRGLRLYPYIKTFSRNMRKNMTSQELKLWQFIRKSQLGIKFRRQHPINNKYIADFANTTKKIIIEIDGSQHIESEKDVFRTYYLESLGYYIIRFYNNDIDNNIEGCIEYLKEVINNLPPTPACAGTSPCKGAEYDAKYLPPTAFYATSYLQVAENTVDNLPHNKEYKANQRNEFELNESVCEDEVVAEMSSGQRVLSFVNDLEWAIIDDYKELQYIKQKYPKSVMTGSGSTYFVIGDVFDYEKDYWIKNNLKSINYGVKEVK